MIITSDEYHEKERIAKTGKIMLSWQDSEDS